MGCSFLLPGAGPAGEHALVPRPTINCRRFKPYHVAMAGVVVWIVVCLSGLPIHGQAEFLASADTLSAPESLVLDAALATGPEVIAALFVEESLDAQGLRLAYGTLSPSENLLPLGPLGEAPFDPELVADSEGLLHAVWAARGANGQGYLRYALAEPESGEAEQLLVATTTGGRLPAMPCIVLDPVTRLARIAWQEGTGTAQTIRVWTQHADGSSTLDDLTDPARPAFRVYPQLFMQPSVGLGAAWYSFEAGSLVVRAQSTLGRPTYPWLDWPAPSSGNLPARRLPALYRDDLNQAISALYLDEAPYGLGASDDVLIHHPIVPPGNALPLALAPAGACGTLGMIGSDGKESLAWWLVAAPSGHHRLQILHVPVGDERPASGLPYPLPAPALWDWDLGPGVAGLRVAARHDDLHLLWWSDVLDGGTGDLRYLSVSGVLRD